MDNVIASNINFLYSGFAVIKCRVLFVNKDTDEDAF